MKYNTVVSRGYDVTWRCQECDAEATVFYDDSVAPLPDGWSSTRIKGKLPYWYEDPDELESWNVLCPDCVARRDAAYQDKVRRWEAGEEFLYREVTYTHGHNLPTGKEQMVTKDTWPPNKVDVTVSGSGMFWGQPYADYPFSW